MEEMLWGAPGSAGFSHEEGRVLWPALKGHDFKGNVKTGGPMFSGSGWEQGAGACGVCHLCPLMLRAQSWLWVVGDSGGVTH